MPSPVGHALGGCILGALVSGVRPSLSRTWWRDSVTLGALGVAADLDFLVGRHSQYTHSIAAVAVVGAIALAVTRGRARWAIAASAAYASHILLDVLGHDSTPPIGVMALWPFTDAYYQSDLHVFMAISRRYWLPGFVTHNLTAIAWELVLLGPLAVAVWWRRRRRAQ